MTYDSSMSLNYVLAAVERGDHVLCPKCGASLIVALDNKTMAQLQVHRGVYCGNDRSHVAIMVEVKAAHGFWEQFKK